MQKITMTLGISSLKEAKIRLGKTLSEKIMLNTNLHVSRKFEKTIKKRINSECDKSSVNPYFGSWNSEIFYVGGKKCWLFSNKLTNFSFIVPYVSNSEIGYLSIFFRKSFEYQLEFEQLSEGKFELIDFYEITKYLNSRFFKKPDKSWAVGIELMQDLITKNEQKFMQSPEYKLFADEHIKKTSHF